MWTQKINQQLSKQYATNRYRTRIANTGGNCRYIDIGSRRYLNFASNDYLGMSTNPNIIGAWQQGATRFGLGSGGSGHVTGYSIVHQQFEEQLADWLGFERALLFTSGFAANQALIYALIEQQDTIIADKLVHASIQEAAHLKTRNYFRFRHNDLQSLVQIYQRINKPSLLITEGVFSMDGDTAPLAELQQIAAQHQSWLMVDDAHGIGVLGDKGKGSCNLQKIKPNILIVTFGKAFGLNGAAILCHHDVAEFLQQQARHLIYSTSMPIAQAYALQTALAEINNADDRRTALNNNIARFKQIALSENLLLTDSNTAIQPFIVGKNEDAINLATRLKEKGIWLSAIRPPTVPAGQARLRITLSSNHKLEDIIYLVETLANEVRHCQSL